MQEVGAETEFQSNDAWWLQVLLKCHAHQISPEYFLNDNSLLIAN